VTDGIAPRRRALITGASSGIGLAFAHVLAEHGHDLILTARRRDRLERLAAELNAQHGTDACVLVEDLASTTACNRLIADIAARGLQVDILVNNAGFGVPGRYAATTWKQQQDFLQVMVVTVAELTHGLVPGMIDRQWGRIINVASLAGLLPAVAGHTLYAAAKAFVIKFSEALALESRRHGIHVTATCPGFTLSEFHDVTGTRAQVNTMPAFMWLHAEHVARGSYDAVMAAVPLFVPGRINRTVATLGRLLPQPLVARLMQRNAGKFRRV
jgi:short-subunit dehydrogenase